MDELIKCNIVYGTVEIVETRREAGDYVYYGSYTIHRDRDGVEVSRTEPMETCRAYFPPEPKKTLWQKLKEWM